MSNEEGDDLSFEALTFGDGKQLTSPTSPTDKKQKDQKANKTKKRADNDSPLQSPTLIVPSSPTSSNGISVPSVETIPIISSSPVSTSLPGSVATPPADKPDTILVLKNLPFSLKQDQLEEILRPLSENVPQSVNLHYEGGIFKGMAFIKYKHIEEAIKVFDALNGLDVGGRKVRVEYKRKNKDKVNSPSSIVSSGEVPPEWSEDEELKKIWEQLNEFKTNHTQMELSFAPTLTSVHRKHIHAMAEKLKLTHFSMGDDHDRHICVSKKPVSSPAHHTGASNNNNNNGVSGSLERSRGIDIQGGNRSRGNSNTGRSFEGGNSFGKSWERNDAGSFGSSFGSSFGRPRGSFGAAGSFSRSSYLSSSPVDRSNSSLLDNHASHVNARAQNISTSPTSAAVFGTSPSNGLNGNSTPVGSVTDHNGPLIQPVRQPKGPDGTKGFPDLYRNKRSSSPSSSPASSPQPLTTVVS
eukprot:TRINITY_DN1439_c0_g1_i7.p1 TRINITY_DN1439_c0_g1~~TRINITY_DN1439_c0_g1_i7.p1  ORF type:complete len:467 (-),score=116.69 TRINITY_DN1439_c0_g1_i7:236-1636(-)